MNEINNKKIVEYDETKNHYIVLYESALIKNPETMKWVECVIYQSYKKSTPFGYEEIPEEEKKIFVREKKDFMSKFSLCLDI